MSPRARLRLLTLLTLLGALLLFGLEPLVGRLLLPSCGGGFHVWATCLTAFQGTLFLGYLYCHLLAPKLGRWHLAVAAAPLLFLPLALLPEHSPAPPLVAALSAAGVGLAQPDSHAPVLSILRALALGMVVPFAVLSTTAIVAQGWLARSDLPERDDPYRLYAASNLGSLVALLGYPLLVEPFVTLRAQRLLWSGLYLVYLGVLVAAAPRRATSTPEPATPEPAAAPVAETPPPTWRDILFWLGLSAAPSMFLVAVTNVIALDVGSMPLVWVVPLALYLLSFVLIFGRRPFYPALLRRFWPEICVVGSFFFVQQANAATDKLLAFVHLSVLFVVCLVGHGELHATRPAPRHLTIFYLMLALGGWIGGAFATLVAPAVLTSLGEYLIALVLLGVTYLLRYRAQLKVWIKDEPRAILLGSVILCVIVVGRTVQSWLNSTSAAPLYVVRNAYGIYKVTDRVMLPETQREIAADLDPTSGTKLLIRTVTHGTTHHGAQVQHPRAGRRPISYYHQKGPLGEAMTLARERANGRPLAGGVVGLGAGTTAAYFGSPGDSVTFYELDPDVETIARTYFTYLSDAGQGSGVPPRVVIGDARLKVANDAGAPAGGFDVLLIDAFSSDAIPVHLLTREALATFASRLAPDGLLLFHVSNRYYRLQPALVSTARAVGLSAAQRTRASEGTLALLEDPSDYVAMAAKPETLATLVDRGWVRAGSEVGATVTPWTDDFSNLLGTLYELE